MKKKTLRNVAPSLFENEEEILDYFDMALEGANLGIWDWYLTDNSVRFDRRWAEMLGLDHTKIAMELSTWESRVHPDDLAKCYEDIQAYLSGKTDIYENIHRMKHNDGRWIYILDRGRVSAWDREGNPTRFTGTHFDITKSEYYRKKISIFFDNSPFGYAFCDMQGNLLEINSRYAEITGYSLEELKKLSYWDITPRKYEKQEQEQIKSMEEKGRYGPYRKEYIRKDGNIVPVELNGFVVEDYDGMKGIWSTVEDITEKVQLEAKLLHASKLASVGELAAGVGHEINNPLAIIYGLVDQINRKHPENSELQQMTRRINASIDRISKIVSSLRTFSQKDSSNVESVDLHKSIDEAKAMIEGAYLKTNMQVNVRSKTESTLNILGNKGRLQQIFINLFSNAIDATPITKACRIDVDLSQRNDQVEITISDNGEGIPTDLIDKIFDPFFTTKDVNGGTGIGLSIVHGIVKEHDGDIQVSSTPGMGTTFTLRFPITNISAEELLHPIQKRPQHSPIEALTGSVMLVDDEEEFRALLAESLTELGLEVFEFGNGHEALLRYNQEPEKFDLIISDIQMPQMTGTQLLKKVRSQKEKPQPRFLMITGGIKDNFNRKESALVDGYIYKPFRINEIAGQISQILNLKKSNY